jgi:hypothetical protein
MFNSFGNVSCYAHALHILHSFIQSVCGGVGGCIILISDILIFLWQLFTASSNSLSYISSFRSCYPTLSADSWFMIMVFIIPHTYSTNLIKLSWKWRVLYTYWFTVASLQQLPRGWSCPVAALHIRTSHQYTSCKNEVFKLEITSITIIQV